MPFAAINVVNGYCLNIPKVQVTPILDSPDFYYRADLNSISGGNLYNSTTLSYDAPLTGGVTSANLNGQDFRYGSASLALSRASQQYIDLSSKTYNFAANAGQTFCCWVKTTANATTNRVALASFGSDISTACMLSLGNGVDGTGFYEYNKGQEITVGNVNYANGQWVHIAWVFGNTTTRKIYVNGTLIHDYSASGVAYAENATGSYNRLFSNVTDTNQNVDGQIDDVRLFPRILTDSEISSVYNPTVLGAIGTRTETDYPILANNTNINNFLINFTVSKSNTVYSYGSTAGYYLGNIWTTTASQSALITSSSRDVKINYKGNLIIDRLGMRIITYSSPITLLPFSSQFPTGITNMEDGIFVIGNRPLLVPPPAVSKTLFKCTTSSTNPVSYSTVTDLSGVNLITGLATNVATVNSTIDGRMLVCIANATGASTDAQFAVYKLVTNPFDTSFVTYSAVQTTLVSNVLTESGFGAIGNYSSRSIKMSSCGSFIVVCHMGATTKMFVYKWSSVSQKYIGYADISLNLVGLNATPNLYDVYPMDLAYNGTLYYAFYNNNNVQRPMRSFDLSAPPFSVFERMDIPDPDNSFRRCLLTNASPTASPNGLSDVNTCIIKLICNLKNDVSGVIFTSTVTGETTTNALVIYMHNGTLYTQAGVCTLGGTREMYCPINCDTFVPHTIYVSFALNDTYDVQMLVINGRQVQRIATPEITTNVTLSSTGTASLNAVTSPSTIIRGSNQQIDPTYFSAMNISLSIFSNAGNPLCL